ncbi:hypothetical protein EGR_09542 [Echinococcus granulosus]|uniref:Uncharacterized protein n=1 Tax=Echinococcus granulosus TaxID=6210 RepID=W6UAV6_ECHGR|nr:hypothetical protein EGR_09542 [Echinococcus granulosus]EUB55602.1 hypothetical protein EGR_09542 [Echinococcus granulosus]
MINIECDVEAHFEGSMVFVQDRRGSLRPPRYTGHIREVVLVFQIMAQKMPQM